MQPNTTYTLITGGSEGIGLELAKQFASHGHNLVIVARNEEQLQIAKAALQSGDVDVITISKDLFEPNSAFELFEEIKTREITIDILVNNAGQGVYGLFKDTEIQRELAIIQLNISTPVTFCKLFLTEMLKRGEGKILNVSSIASEMPGPWQSVYHGTKAFIQSFSEALNVELKDKGITVTTLLPGATDTDFFNKADMLESKIAQDKKKLSDPADVAKDGYEALMSGDNKVISGFKNKSSVAMGNLMPDSTAARFMKKQQEPIDKSKNNKD